MKVIHVLNQFLPYHVAGTEIYTWALCKQLKLYGTDAKIVFPNYGKHDAESYFFDDISVYRYSEPSIEDRDLIMGFRAPDGLKNFIEYLASECPDVVHFHELAAGSGITLKHIDAVKDTGAKVVMTFHLANYTCKTGALVYKGETLCDGVIDLQKCSNCYLHAKGYSKAAPYLTTASLLLHKMHIDSSQWKHRVGTAFGTVALLYRLKSDLHTLVAACDRVVTITKWYERVLKANAVDACKISYIPQGLPLAINAEFVERKAGRPLRLLFLGRINKFKGLHLLLDALNSVDSSLVELSIYGNSDDASYEADLKAGTTNRTNIFWKGKLAQQDVVKTMQEHDVLCLCSTFSEMSPLVIQEAFAAGIPVLASEVYGNAEQIQHGVNGLLFKFNRVDSLREQIVQLLEEEELYPQLKRAVRGPIAFEEVGRRYVALYREILNG